MDLKCPVCGKEITELNYMNQQSKKVYCSTECKNADQGGRILFAGFLSIAAFTFITIYLFSKDAPEIAAIFGPIFFVLALSLIFIGTRFSRLRNKIKEEESYNKSESIEKKKDRFTCFFCGTLITLKSGEDPVVCMTCGNKLLYCDLCNNYISKNEKVLKLEPCGHIFHNKELLKWIEDNKQCPKCKGTMNFVDVNPDFS